jgi:transcription elongation factor Elf1
MLHMTPSPGALTCPTCSSSRPSTQSGARQRGEKGKKKTQIVQCSVCERRVDLLVCSLPLHRHSYIGFILAFASSIHNKQLSCSRLSLPSTKAGKTSWPFKSQVGLTLTKTAAVRITLNLDGAPIISNSHTHPSHSLVSIFRYSSSSNNPVYVRDM